jgi:hypothetical protein
MTSTHTFKLSHSLFITVVLIFIELVLSYVSLPVGIGTGIILLVAAVGALANIYIATEVVEEVRGSRHMLVILSVIMLEFVVFFAFQYWFLQLAQPSSFPTLDNDAVSLVLNSVMVFVFNPLYAPATLAARAMLLIDTFGALGLVLFVLQNITSFRHKSLDISVD